MGLRRNLLAVAGLLATTAAGAQITSIKDFGAKCDGTTDDTAAINSALDAVGAIGGEVYIPAGTCVIAPSGFLTTYLHLHNNLTIRGAGPRSVLKVKSGVGNYRAIFSGVSGPLLNVTFKDFTVDQNPSGNNAAPTDIRAVGTDCPSGANTCQQDVIAPQTNITGLTVTGMVFDPTTAVNTIVAGSDGDLRATITNNYFKFVKGRTLDKHRFYDNSAVYLEGSQQVVSGNTFLSTLADKANAAIETHGGRSSVSENTANKYAVLVNVVPTFSIFAELKPNDIVIANNSVTNAQYGISIWPATNRTLRNVSITGNTIHVNNAGRAETPLFEDAYAGIRTVWSTDGNTDGHLDGLTISNNVISMQKENRSYRGLEKLSGGILLLMRGNLVNAIVSGNVVKDAPSSGIRVDATLGASAAQRVRVIDNIIVDAGNNDLLAVPYRHAIGLFDVAKNIDVMRNMIYDTANGAKPFGSRSLDLEQAAGSVNVRTSDNSVHLAGTGSLVSPSSRNGHLDVGANQDTLTVNPVAPGAVLIPDPISHTRYHFQVNAETGAFTIANTRQWYPGHTLTFRIINASGGVMGAITWGTMYKMAAWTNPANGFSRSITFVQDGTHWYEIGRTPADVPN